MFWRFGNSILSGLGVALSVHPFHLMFYLIASGVNEMPSLKNQKERLLSLVWAFTVLLHIFSTRASVRDWTPVTHCHRPWIRVQWSWWARAFFCWGLDYFYSNFNIKQRQKEAKGLIRKLHRWGFLQTLFRSFSIEGWFNMTSSTASRPYSLILNLNKRVSFWRNAYRPPLYMLKF